MPGGRLLKGRHLDLATRDIRLGGLLRSLCFSPLVFQPAFLGFLLFEILPEFAKADFELVPLSLELRLAARDLSTFRVQRLE